MGKLRVLDLFSGIGGFSLGLERTGGFETVAFCEIEEFPRRVLAKHWPEVPLHNDVRKLNGVDVGPVDVICGGYPCQPFSTAGRRQGAEDDRHLWPEFSRLVAELRPTWVIGENVAGHISMGLDDVLSDLERQGYACRTFVVPACAVNARHRRDRCWTIGHANKDGQPSLSFNEQMAELRGLTSFIADASSVRWQGRSVRSGELTGTHEEPARSALGRTLQSNATAKSVSGKRSQRRQVGRVGWEECFSRARIGQISSEPFVRRRTHGIPNRMDRLKGLGNAVVPQIPELIGHAILEAVDG